MNGLIFPHLIVVCSCIENIHAVQFTDFRCFFLFSDKRFSALGFGARIPPKYEVSEWFVYITCLCFVILICVMSQWTSRYLCNPFTGTVTLQD